MMFAREREGEVALRCLGSLAALLAFASDCSHYWAYKACFMSGGVGCPLLCLVVWGGGLGCLHACVSSDEE